jgi:hypothetical protein
LGATPTPCRGPPPPPPLVAFLRVQPPRLPQLHNAPLPPLSLPPLIPVHPLPPPLPLPPQLLSCHWRLGTPLPARDAARLAQDLATGGACCALDLHEAVLAAAADLAVNGPSPAAADLAVDGPPPAAAARQPGPAPAAATAPAGDGPLPAATATATAARDGTASGQEVPAGEVYDAVWRQLSVLPAGAPTLGQVSGCCT